MRQGRSHAPKLPSALLHAHSEEADRRTPATSYRASQMTSTSPAPGHLAPRHRYRSPRAGRRATAQVSGAAQQQTPTLRPRAAPRPAPRILQRRPPLSPACRPSVQGPNRKCSAAPTSTVPPHGLPPEDIVRLLGESSFSIYIYKHRISKHGSQ